MNKLYKTTQKTERVGVGYLTKDGTYIARINVKGLKKGKKCKTFEEAVAVREEFERQAAIIKRESEKEKKEKIEETQNICDEYCNGCMYKRYLYLSGVNGRREGTKYCDYICMVGKSRPCKAGKECTVKKEGSPNEYIKKLKSPYNLFI